MTDRLMLARSSTLVERPIIESPEICAFWSMSDLFSGSDGKEYADWPRNCSEPRT